MSFSIIAAKSINNVVGLNNKLPWRIPSDLKRFKELTSGKTIIMGRSTYESIGKILPNRRNVILSRDTTYRVEGGFVVNSTQDAINICQSDEEVFVIGGSSVWQDFFNICDKVYLTVVKENIEGDTYINLDLNEKWEISHQEDIKGEKDDYSTSYIVYKKVK